MKKIISLLLVAVLLAALSAPAFAAPQTKQTELSFTYVAEPVYTVVIPASVNLHYGETEILIKLTESEPLNGKTVRVTFEGTQDEDNLFILQAGDMDGGGIVSYTLDVYTEPNWGGYEHWHTYQKSSGDEYLGRTVAAFTDVGESAYYLEITDMPDDYYAYHYGYITFGIKLV